MATDFFRYTPDAPPAPPAPPAAADAPAALPPSVANANASASAATDPARGILADLADEDWDKFIGHAARRRYPAGSVVVAADEPHPALYFVASGQVRVQRPGEAAVVRGNGEVVGLLSFLDGAPSAAEVVATSETELLLLTPDALLQLAAWQPRIAVTLLRDLGAHVAARLRRFEPGD